MPAKKGQKKRGKRILTYKNVEKGVNLASKVAALAFTVAKVVKLVNVEKKRFVVSGDASTPNAVGQINAQSASTYIPGYFTKDITPIPAQGTTSITRNGNSIKLVSSYVQIQLWHQSATAQPIRAKIYVVMAKGSPETSSDSALGEFLSTNPFVTGLIDSTSNVNPDYFGQYKVVKQLAVHIQSDSVTGGAVIKTIKFGLRYNKDKGHHIRFTADGATTLAGGNLYLFVVADSGNISSTALTSGTSFNNIPVTIANSGLVMNHNIIHYFVDN